MTLVAPDVLLAKTPFDGALLLRDHAHQAGCAARRLAMHLGWDVSDCETAYHGGVLHDLGKAHPEYQQRLRDPRLFREALDPAPLRHELVSLLFLPAFDRSEWDLLIEMVAAHHKSIENDPSQRGLLDIVERCRQEEIEAFYMHAWESWMPAVMEILRDLGFDCESIERGEARDAFAYACEYCEGLGRGLSWPRGVLMAADYFASALRERTENRLAELFTTPDLQVFEPATPDPLYPLSGKAADSSLPHTMVLSPTGSGKTNYLLRRCRGRVFYVLPFQASINAMAVRLQKALPDADIRLLHSASRLQTSNGAAREVKEERALQNLMGAGIKVLTPHQIAAIVLGLKGYEALACDIRNSDVIFDEVHVYNGRLQSLVLMLLPALQSLGCRIHVGTATMPEALRVAVLENLGGPQKVHVQTLRLAEERIYARHIVHKLPRGADFMEIIAQHLGKKEKILVVLNRVDAAQLLAQECFQKFQIPILLLHSRFRRMDRAALEAVLMQEFEQRPGPCLVISTQVVEVSLDISFDVLLSDCAPIDSLIQRMGRINRRPGWDLPPRPVYIAHPPANEGDAKPYVLEILRRSYAAIEDGELAEPAALQRKIDTVYPDYTAEPIDDFLIFRDGAFCRNKLTHVSRVNLLQLLEITDGVGVLAEDAEAYRYANQEERSAYEIALRRSQYAALASNGGRVLTGVGNEPAVIPDDLYDAFYGLRLPAQRRAA